MILERNENSEDIDNEIVYGIIAIRELHPIIYVKNIKKYAKRKKIQNCIRRNSTLWIGVVGSNGNINERRLRAMEIDFSRQSRHLTKLNRLRNDENRRRDEVSLGMDIIKAKQWKLYGHLRRTTNEMTLKSVEMTAKTKKKKGATEAELEYGSSRGNVKQKSPTIWLEKWTTQT